MLDLINRLIARLTVRDEEGQGMVEYGLIIAFVAIIVIVALALIGPRVSNIYVTAANSL